MGTILLFTGCNNSKKNQNSSEVITFEKNIEQEFAVKGNVGSDLAIKDSKDNILEIWTSSDEAHVIIDLAPGIYTIEEIKPAEGYTANNKIIKLKVKQNLEAIEEINMRTELEKEVIKENLKDYLAFFTTTGTILGGFYLGLFIDRNEKKKLRRKKNG